MRSHQGMTFEEVNRRKLERIDETHRCSSGNCALLIIDMQHGFLDQARHWKSPRAVT